MSLTTSQEKSKSLTDKDLVDISSGEEDDSQEDEEELHLSLIHI